MRSLHTTLLSTAAGVLTLFAAGQATAAPPIYQHVLLISVDGLHSIDLANYIQNHPTSNMAGLASHGIVYPNAFTTAPSDSYPGMLAQVTGASPKTAGLFYDDSYDRHEYPSVNYWLSQNLPDPGCTGGAGTEVTNFEELDKGYNFQTQLVSDLTGGGTLDQVYTQLDTDNMQRHIVNGACKPIFPHEYVRANTIFEIAKSAGLYTAWSDKHPAYEDLAGPSGKGLDELFAPEINSQDTLDQGAQSGDDYTSAYTATRTYDSIKVKAVLNWIDGFNAVGTQKLASAPAIFGMNFQAVSVGQKLAQSGDADVNKTLTGGYLDSNATPGTALTIQLQFVDDALGKFRKALYSQGLASSTLIIVSAKHGQSPIDVRDRVTMSDAPFQGVPGFGTHGFEICDDEGLIWLEPDLEKTNYQAAKSYLLAHAGELHIAQLLDRSSLTSLYEDPFHNSRVPDFIAVTDHGVICTGGTKLAEHGGFSDDDRNVALLLSAPGINPQIVESLVYTTQIAPTILQALGLNPGQLIGVQKEGTQVLTY